MSRNSSPATGEAALAAIERARLAALEAERQRAEMHRRAENIREERRRNHFAPDIFDAMQRRRT